MEPRAQKSPNTMHKSYWIWPTEVMVSLELSLGKILNAVLLQGTCAVLTLCFSEETIHRHDKYIQLLHWKTSFCKEYKCHHCPLKLYATFSWEATKVSKYNTIKHGLNVAAQAFKCSNPSSLTYPDTIRCCTIFLSQEDQIINASLHIKVSSIFPDLYQSWRLTSVYSLIAC